MKRSKILTALLIFNILITPIAFCDEKEDFFNSLLTCTESTYDVGRKIITILGSSNRLCYFTEITNQRTMNCSLNEIEVFEFVDLLQTNFDYNIGISSSPKAVKFLKDRKKCTVIGRPL